LNLRNRAIGLLARREHSRAELARKLMAHAESEEVFRLLDELESEGLLSDERYAEALSHARAGRYGSLRLGQELREKGVPEGLIDAAVGDAREHDLAACRAIWEKKFGQLPNGLKERAKQTRFLVSRGFPAATIARVLGGVED
jgi:regulatory protein